MSTSPEDVAALFDLAPLPAAAEPAADAADATEAQLAAEIAAAIESGDFAADAPESRTDLRVKVSWPARMQLPDGQIIELQVRDISMGGVGLVSREQVPASTVVNFEMDVPPLGEDGEVGRIKGSLKTTYAAVHGSEILCGGTWQVPPVGLELVRLWIRRLRG